MPSERAIDLDEDLETQHMLQLGLAQLSASLARPLASASEIRFVGLRNRMEILIEVIVRSGSPELDVPYAGRPRGAVGGHRVE